MKVDGRQMILDTFRMTGCLDCGWRPADRGQLIGMDCEHPDSSVKWGRETFLSGSRAAMSIIYEELWKCDPVCNQTSLQWGGQDCHGKRRVQRKEQARQDELRRRWDEWNHHKPFSDHQAWLRETGREAE